MNNYNNNNNNKMMKINNMVHKLYNKVKLFNKE